MSDNIKPIGLIILSLSIVLFSCKNDNRIKDIEQTETRPVNQNQQILPERDSRIIDSLFEYEINKELFNKKENNYHVHGTDDEGNKVFGTITIDGKVGIGTIRGDEAKGIEVIAERTSHNILIATDIKGYEYQLKLDHN